MHDYSFIFHYNTLYFISQLYLKKVCNKMAFWNTQTFSIEWSGKNRKELYLDIWATEHFQIRAYGCPSGLFLISWAVPFETPAITICAEVALIKPDDSTKQTVSMWALVARLNVNWLGRRSNKMASGKKFKKLRPICQQLTTSCHHLILLQHYHLLAIAREAKRREKARDNFFIHQWKSRVNLKRG